MSYSFFEAATQIYFFVGWRCISAEVG